MKGFKNMTQETLDFLHRAYNRIASSPKTSNIIDILEELQMIIELYNAPAEDVDELEIFCKNINSSIKARKKTFQLTNMVADIVYTMMYIAIWANSERNLDIDINILARRKALESELTKFLQKGEVHDRFGIRGIVLNNDSEDDSIETQKLYQFCQYVINILTHGNEKDFEDFLKWKDSNNLRYINKARIEYILSFEFKVTNVKDYISCPKENGYKSYHFVLSLYEDEFELQFRTNRMHQHSVNGEAKHSKYKNRLDASIKNVFRIDDFSKVYIVGFTSYNSPDDDIDGIHHAKSLFNRRISRRLIVKVD